MNKKLQKKLDREILKHDVISFDIFDTLLVRPYVKPTDLFLHMEKHYGMPGFAEHRINAELKAREKIQPDVTLDDIYNEIDDTFVDMKQRELDWEEMVLRSNPQMIDVYNFAKSSGKKIVIASDMYLPTDFIKKVLEKNGFSGFDRLYVSGDLGIAKANGTMYEAIIRATNVNPNKILHIGDNKYSDFTIPKSLGIQTFLVPRIVEQYIKLNQKVKIFLDACPDNLGASILTALFARHYVTKNTNDTYWHDLGYEYTGPLAYSYVSWVNAIATKKNLSCLLYIARDGYVLDKVQKKINKNITSHYVYAPRYINLIFRLDYRTDDSDVALAHQNTIIKHYINEIPKFKELYKKTDFKKTSSLEFLDANKQMLIPFAHKKLVTYQNYLEKLNVGKSVGVVDTITQNFSAQKLLIDGFGKKDIFGFYFKILDPKRKPAHSHCYGWIDCSLTKKPEWVAYWPLVEFLLTSPEYPIEGISTSGAPIYKKNISKDEYNIRKIYPFIADRACDFTDDLLSIFKGIDTFIDFSTIMSWLNVYIFNPTARDKNYMFKIYTATNPNNDSYAKLFGGKLPLVYILKHPFKVKKIIKQFLWKTKMQEIFFVLLSPIKIKMNGIKRIRIFLFPKLKHKLFCVSLCLFDNYIYRFVIGKQEKL